MKKQNKKALFSWCLYDWANSSFSTVIITFVFSVYFAKEVAPDEVMGSAWWSYAIALSGLMIAFISPFMGAMADITRDKKKWVFVFSMLCIISSAFLWFAMPAASTGYILLILGVVAMANVGNELAQVFYNSTLTDITAPEKRGRVSGWGWGVGYAGGLTALISCLLLFIGLGDSNPVFDLSQEKSEHIRIVGPFIAIWFFVFMLPFLYFYKVPVTKQIKFFDALRIGAKKLVADFKNFKGNQNLFTFLIASALYRDGLITLFAIGGIYAATQFDMSFTQILIFAAGLNVTAAIGAFLFAYVDDWIGSKPTIIISLSALIIIGVVILLIQTALQFIIVSLVLGIFIGPVQAASRTMVSTLSDAEDVGQAYGLYALTGKSISFLGPLLFGLATTIFATQKAGMIVIILLWFVGLLLLMKVKEKP